MTDTQALEHARALVSFCEQQKSCQNCIFREYEAFKWGCIIDSYNLKEVVNNIIAKKKNHGFI